MSFANKGLIYLRKTHTTLAEILSEFTSRYKTCSCGTSTSFISPCKTNTTLAKASTTPYGAQTAISKHLTVGANFVLHRHVKI